MKRRTRWIMLIVILVVVAGGGMQAVRMAGAGEVEISTVSPHRGDLVDRALATGTIEPEVVVSVKSMLSGVVKHEYAQPGEFVRAGDPLLELQPTPTPLELSDARRNVELRRIALEHADVELRRQETLAERGIISRQEYEGALRRRDEAELQLNMVTDRLALMEDGRITVADQHLETVVTSPVSGFILEKMVEAGDPVVPLSSFQAGTVLMTMADMSRLVFRGTVDEIDVGRLQEGMDAEIRIGALPDATITGVLSRISLRSRRQENATVFPIEILITDTDGLTLRAGYSANAHVLIESREDVLLLPERLIEFDDDGAWVTVEVSGETERRKVKTGLSDAMHVEVLSGLEESDRVVEPVRGPRT